MQAPAPPSRRSQTGTTEAVLAEARRTLEASRQQQKSMSVPPSTFPAERSDQFRTPDRPRRAPPRTPTESAASSVVGVGPYSPAALREAARDSEGSGCVVTAVERVPFSPEHAEAARLSTSRTSPPAWAEVDAHRVVRSARNQLSPSRAAAEYTPFDIEAYGNSGSPNAAARSTNVEIQPVVGSEAGTLAAASSDHRHHAATRDSSIPQKGSFGGALPDEDAFFVDAIRDVEDPLCAVSSYGAVPKPEATHQTFVDSNKPRPTVAELLEHAASAPADSHRPGLLYKYRQSVAPSSENVPTRAPNAVSLLSYTNPKPVRPSNASPHRAPPPPPTEVFPHRRAPVPPGAEEAPEEAVPPLIRAGSAPRSSSPPAESRLRESPAATAAAANEDFLFLNDRAEHLAKTEKEKNRDATASLRELVVTQAWLQTTTAQRTQHQILLEPEEREADPTATLPSTHAADDVVQASPSRDRRPWGNAEDDEDDEEDAILRQWKAGHNDADWEP